MSTSGSSLGQHLVSLQKGWFLQVNDFSRHTSWLHEPFHLYAVYGVALFGLLLLGTWWFSGRRQGVSMVARSLWAPCGVLIAVGLNQPLGRLVAEARPYTVFPHSLTLVARTTDFSFPSDHAVMAGAAAAGIWLVSRRLGLVTTVLAVLIAFARVYVGAHWPIDVVAGLAFGALVTLVGHLLLHRPLEWVVDRIGRTALSPLVRAAA
ncbi:phosphatase PAP2 family protein [Nocardioides terrisoli]|uniref:phosphatase PAP2 family protein n=1 Tax=Nocardioides terrisoli TaxID=3388267 RepID=UPI00287B67AB|nr:phosphatase PAP2 family protein [Nocardioides marmorisolisilvae]